MALRPELTIVLAFGLVIAAVLIAGYATTINLSESKCDAKPDPGSCNANIIRYYFDKSEGACKQFVWTGCYGNAPFKTLEACQKTCET